MNDYTLFLLLSGVVGLAAGGGVVLFRMTYQWITALVLSGSDGHSVVDAIRHQPAWSIVATIAIGGLLVALIQRLAAQHGLFPSAAARSQQLHHVRHLPTRTSAHCGAGVDGAYKGLHKRCVRWGVQ